MRVHLVARQNGTFGGRWQRTFVSRPARLQAGTDVRPQGAERAGMSQCPSSCEGSASPGPSHSAPLHSARARLRVRVYCAPSPGQGVRAPHFPTPFLGPAHVRLSRPLDANFWPRRTSAPHPPGSRVCVPRTLREVVCSGSGCPFPARSSCTCPSFAHSEPARCVVWGMLRSAHVRGRQTSV